jgi:hypothetical protein
MPRVRLPASDLVLELCPPSGLDDVLLAQAAALDTELAIAFGSRLARRPDGSHLGALDLAALPLTDLDVLFLEIRRMLLGNTIRADVSCPVGSCGARIDVSFRVSDYLAHHTPRRPLKRSAGLRWPRGVERRADGWFALRGTDVSFRLPSGADRVAIRDLDSGAAERALVTRCIRPADLPPASRRRVERAMEALAPNLADDLEGQCPECQVTVHIPFDPQRYVLAELRERAMFVYEDVHLLAGRYGWSERAILRMPRERRVRYAEMIHDERRAPSS